MAGERTLKVTILGDADKLRRAFGQAGDAADGFATKSAKVAKVAGAALVASGAVVGVFAKRAVDAASNMAETQSKVGVIFGSSAKDVEKFASTAARQLGQSKQAALDASATFATFGKSAGLAGPDLVKFSTTLTGLSSDLASFHNTKPEDAIQALGAALRGESEPMRRYGVLLDDATLKARAMSLGVYDGIGPLNAQQKVLSAQAEVLAQTSDAQGDFARTSEGLANKQRIVSATMSDLTATVGAALLPVMLEIVTAFQGAVEWAAKLYDIFQKDGLSGAVSFLKEEIGRLLDKLGPIGEAIRSFGETIQPVTDWFRDFARENPEAVFAALGAVIATVVLPPTIAWAAAMVAAAAPIVAVVLAVGALTAAVVWAYQNVEWFRDLVDTAWDVIRSAVTGAWKAIDPTIDAFVAAGSALAGFYKDTVAPVLGAAWSVISAVVDTAWRVVEPLIAAFIAGGRGLYEFFRTVVAPNMDAAWKAIDAVVDVVWTAVKANIAAFELAGRALATAFDNVVKPVVSAAWNAMKSAIDTAWGAIKATIAAFDSAGSALSKAWSTVIGPAISAAFNAVKSTITLAQPVIEGVLSALGTAFDAVRAAVETLLGKVQDVIDLIAAIPRAISIGISFITDKLPDIPGAIGGAIGKINPFNAEGGYFDRATFGVFGEAGPEVILPLTDPSRMRELLTMPEVAPAVMGALTGTSGGASSVGLAHARASDTYNVTVHVHGTVTSERDLVIAVRDGLLQAKREGVTIGLA